LFGNLNSRHFVVPRAIPRLSDFSVSRGTPKVEQTIQHGDESESSRQTD
jgi:hypothetical protein